MVTGKHTRQTRISEHERLTMKMLVTLRISFCRVITKTRHVLPTRPTANMVLYATMRKVVLLREVGQTGSSNNHEPELLFR